MKILTTKEAIIASFWKEINLDRKLLRQKNKRDFLGQHTYDIRNAFTYFIENLRAEKIISDETAKTITL
jgi:hypothetical protein